MSEVEYAGIVLEDELLNHLVDPESAKTLWKERLDVEMLDPQDEGIQKAFLFQMAWMDEFGKPATTEIFSDETGYIDFHEPIMPVDYLIERFRERYAKKKLRRILKRTSIIADTQGGNDPLEAVRYGFDELSAILQETTVRKNDLDTHNASEVLDRYYKKSEEGFRGPTIGFKEFDNEFGGLSGLVFVAGRLKNYKTWMLIRSAVEALQEQRNVDFYTLEMTPQEIQDRATCMIAGLPWPKFKHGALMPADVKLLQDATDWMREQEHVLRFLQPPPGRRTVPYMRQMSVEQGAEVVYIDQLDKINPTTTTEAGWRDIAFICADLKVAANDFPIFCACQFNRQAEGLKKMADPSKTGLSDAIPQMADMMLGLYSTDAMKHNGILHYGAIASREYELAKFEVKVELSANSNFRVIRKVEWDEEEDA